MSWVPGETNFVHQSMMSHGDIPVSAWPRARNRNG